MLEVFRDSLRCLSFATIFKLTALSLMPIKPRLIKVKLPLGLEAYIPCDNTCEVWRNILHIFCYADYELHPDFVPKEGWIVLDVGAFLGFWLLKAARLVGEEGFVVGVEPNPDAYSIALLNVLANGLNNVRLLNYALGTESGIAKLYITRYPGNASLLRSYAEYMGGVEREVTVRTITLEKLLNSLELGSVDLMKLDVEGYELEILRANEALLKENRIKRLVLEVHTGIVSASAIMTLLEEIGWDVILYDPSLPYQAFIYAKPAR